MSAQISVIIPCYNGKNYITETLATITAQGDVIGEIIVVDDASTDGSAAYMKSLNVPKMMLHSLPINRGIGGARNIALSHVRFPYIAFLDADDLWPEHRCEQLLAAMKQHGTPWAFGAIEHFISPDVAGKVNYALPPVQTGYFASAMLIEASFFARVGSFSDTLKVGEFIDWYDRARGFNIPPAIVSDIVLKRRIHGANSSLSHNKQAMDYLKVARAAIARKKV